MDLIRARCPRFAVSANSVHFAALYNVVTDLLLYRDPAHRAHAKRLEEILFVYEFTEVSELADAVGALQVRIRHARELHDQYQLHFKQLSESGRLDFLALKAELLDLASELNLVVEAITVAQDQKSGTDKDKKSALRLEAQAQDIAWNMMGLDDGELLAKLSVRGVSFTWLHKADNSAANTLSIVDLQALNVTPDAVFVEIIAKHGRAPDHPMAKQGRFLNAMWSVLAPVGGIAIIDQFEWNLHPVRIQLEIRVGRRIMDYIFGSKRERERQRDNTKHLEDEERSPSTNKLLPFSRANGKNESRPEVSVETTPRGSTETRDTRESDTEGDAEKFRPSSRNHVQPMRGSRSSSQHSPKESSTPRSSSSIQVSKSQKGSEGATDHFAYAAKNAAEMRERASMNRTFVYVKIMETTFCLSYKVCIAIWMDHHPVNELKLTCRLLCTT